MQMERSGATCWLVARALLLESISVVCSLICVHLRHLRTFSALSPSPLDHVLTDIRRSPLMGELVTVLMEVSTCGSRSGGRTGHEPRPAETGPACSLGQVVVARNPSPNCSSSPPTASYPDLVAVTFHPSGSDPAEPPDRAVSLLVDLRDLADRSGRTEEVAQLASVNSGNDTRTSRACSSGSSRRSSGERRSAETIRGETSRPDKPRAVRRCGSAAGRHRDRLSPTPRPGRSHRPRAWSRRTARRRRRVGDEGPQEPRVLMSDGARARMGELPAQQRAGAGDAHRGRVGPGGTIRVVGVVERELISLPGDGRESLPDRARRGPVQVDAVRPRRRPASRTGHSPSPR